MNTQVHHEMLTPLKSNTILLEQLLKDMVDKRFVKQREILQTIYVSSKLLLMHTNDLLDQKIIQNGRFVPNMTKQVLSQSIMKTVQLVRATIVRKPLVIQCDVKNCGSQRKYHLFDDLRLQQVLLNLLTNAIKFQAEGVIMVKAAVIDELDFENQT